MSQIIVSGNCRPRRSRGWQTCDLRLCFLLAKVSILFFCSTAPESGNFVSHSGREVGAFRPEGRKKVRIMRSFVIFNSITAEPARLNDGRRERNRARILQPIRGHASLVTATKVALPGAKSSRELRTYDQGMKKIRFHTYIHTYIFF